MVTLPVDDSFMTGSADFQKLNNINMNKLIRKEKNCFGEEASMFNGFVLSVIIDGSILMTQQKIIELLATATTRESFRSQRAMAHYIGVKFRPDICAFIQLNASSSMKIEEAQF